MDKPINVQVAEAVGWTEIDATDGTAWRGPVWSGIPPTYVLRESIPDYSGEWSGTPDYTELMPLIDELFEGAGWILDAAGAYNFVRLADSEGGESQLYVGLTLAQAACAAIIEGGK